MNCSSCRKEILPDAYFCTWCSDFVPAPGLGQKANLFRRWIALMIDPLIAVLLWLVATVVLGMIFRSSPGIVIAASILFLLLYFIWFLVLLNEGVTPGKKLLGLRVVNQQSGRIPGYGKMFVRETFGRFASGAFFGLGYFWAIFDKNAQGWHDKLAGTVVIRRRAVIAARAGHTVANLPPPNLPSRS